MSSLFIDSTKSVAKGSLLPEANPSATSMTGSSRARIKQIRSWFGGISNKSSLPAMSKGKSRTKSGLCCHFRATSHLPPVFWPACVCCGDLSFSLLFDGVSRRWRRVPPIRHRHDPRLPLETPSPRPRGECRHASTARAVAATSARWRGGRRDDSARRRHCRAASRTWSFNTNHLLINLRSDKARNGKANLPIGSDVPYAS